MKPSKALLMQVSGYLLSGVSATVLTVAIFALLVHLGIWYVAASVLSDIFGFIFVFVANKYLVFDKKERIIPHAVRYTLVQIANTAAQALIIYLLVQYTDMDKVLARVLSIGCCVPANFLLYKYFVYV